MSCDIPMPCEIIRFCNKWRYLGEICERFNLTVTDARALLGDLVDAKKLYVKWDDDRRAWANTEAVHECIRCEHFRKWTDGQLHAHDGYCNRRKIPLDAEQLYKCDLYVRKVKG